MAQVNIRLDDALKERGERLFNELGLSFSSAVSVFVSQSLKEGGIPFSITTKTPYYSGNNSADIRQRIADMEKGVNTSPHEIIEVYDE